MKLWLLQHGSQEWLFSAADPYPRVLDLLDPSGPLTFSLRAFV